MPSPPRLRYLLATALVASVHPAPSAQTPQPVPRATVAVVGQADRFTIGQGDFCSPRTEIPRPSDVRFEIPADHLTFFFIRSSLRSQAEHLWCEGDFSFVPKAGFVHIVRYTHDQQKCRLELFAARPGDTPVPMAVTREEGRSCLGR